MWNGSTGTGGDSDQAWSCRSWWASPLPCLGENNADGAADDDDDDDGDDGGLLLFLALRENNADGDWY